jgi:cardiolipin synthase
MRGDATTASHLRIISNRDEEWNLRMEMVKRAERFLLLTTYYFGSDERSGTMVDALAAAARRGVQVVLVIDTFGQRLAQNLSKKADRPRLIARLRSLEAAGARLIWYAPKSLRHRWVGGGAHIKIQVSDQGSALFGSANISHQSFSRWSEVTLEMRGAIVPLLIQEVCTLAALGKSETVELVGSLPPAAASEQPYALRYLREDPELCSGPFFPLGAVRNRLTQAIVDLIDQAQHSLSFTSIYVKPPPILEDAIVRACRRGVKVEVFHSHRGSLGVSHLPWIAASFHAAFIIKEGATIYESLAGEHSKVILVDDRHVAVGSYNLEHAAHDRLIEAMVFTDDARACQHFRTMFNTMKNDAGIVAVPPDWLSALPLVLHAKRELLRPIKRWF